MATPKPKTRVLPGRDDAALPEPCPLPEPAPIPPELAAEEPPPPVIPQDISSEVMEQARQALIQEARATNTARLQGCQQAIEQACQQFGCRLVGTMTPLAPGIVRADAQIILNETAQ